MAPKPRPLEERILDHVRRTRGGCLIWTGFIDRRGQPNATGPGGRQVAVRRFVFEQRHGPIGRKLLRNTCGNSRCVNVDHLELGRSPVPRRQPYRGKLPEAVARTGRCLEGHDDIYRLPNGDVGYCRVCANLRRRPSITDLSSPLG